jgi:hypothetical protein
MPKKTVKNTKKVSKTVKKASKSVEQEPIKVLDLHKPFDLTDVSRETLESYTHYLKEMVNSAGWKLMCQVLEGNLALLEKQIIRKKEVLTNRALSDEEVDKLRDQHEILEELINKPQELIKKYGVAEDPTPSPSYDPYGGNRETVNAATMSDST